MRSSAVDRGADARDATVVLPATVPRYGSGPGHQGQQFDRLRYALSAGTHRDWIAYRAMRPQSVSARVVPWRTSGRARDAIRNTSKEVQIFGAFMPHKAASLSIRRIEGSKGS